MIEFLYGRLVVWVNIIDTGIIVHGHKKVLNCWGYKLHCIEIN